jgi:molybdenum cofactor synthesis domain-containing protein
LAELVQQLFCARVVAMACVPDEVGQIRGRLRAWSAQAVPPDLVLTTGGTGLAPRDVTPEATAGILDRRHPGLLELARLRCYPTTPRAFLSRGEAGVVDRSLVINLPGSRRAATEYLQALADVLPHAIATLRGEAPDHGRADSGEV